MQPLKLTPSNLQRKIKIKLRIWATLSAIPISSKASIPRNIPKSQKLVAILVISIIMTKKKEKLE